MIVFSNGVDEPAAVAADTRVEVVRTFPATPSIVLVDRDLIDLFPQVLADVDDPQVAVDAIEAPTPRIAETPGEDLGATRAAAARGWTFGGEN